MLVLFAAAAYETAVALERISMGSQSGEEASGQAVVTDGGVVPSAWLYGAVAAAVIVAVAIRRRPSVRAGAHAACVAGLGGHRPCRRDWALT